MCLAVYLGSMSPLPSVPWSEAAPGFYARPLASHEESVRDVLPLPHLAFLGAHTGCGCGFITDGADEPADVRRSREALARYAADALRDGPVELYVCWGGDADLPRERTLTLQPAELPQRDDWLAEGTHVRLVEPLTGDRSDFALASRP